MTVRDSAGVTIVENRGRIGPDGGGWGLTSEPSVVIGSFDAPAESQLFRVRGARRLADGRIVVANDGSQELRVFDGDGAFVRRMGGDGEGPGEFRSVLLAGMRGDTLVVLDRRLRRVSLVHPDEGFVRAFNLQESVSAFPMGAWYLDGGSILVQDLPLDAPGGLEDGFQRAPVPLRSADMAGALDEDLGRFPGSDMVSVTRQMDQHLATILRPVPFGKSPQVAVAGGRVYFGSQDTYEIRVYDRGGTLERIVRLDREPVPVSQEDVEAFIESDVAGIQDENEARERRVELEEMPRMERRPAFGAVSADGGGSLFVEDYPRPGTPQVGMSVFDPRGTLTGRFEIPAGLRVLEVGEDYLLGVYEDEMGVESVRLYGLTRGS